MKLKITNNFALINAIVTNLLLCILGIVFGIITNSSSIMFDGMYSFLMLIFSSSIFFLVKYTSCKKHAKHYPYGVGKIENLLSFLKIIFVIVLGIYFCIDSSIMLYTAFTDPAKLPKVPSFEIYIIYISIACAISMYTFIIFKLADRNSSSDLIKVEVKSTLIDFFITAAIGIALVTAALFVHGDIQYVAMVRTAIDKSILFFLIIISTPGLVKLLIQNTYSLLDRKSNHIIADKIYEFIKFDGVQEVSILSNSNTTCVMIYVTQNYMKNLTKKQFNRNEKFIHTLISNQVFIEYILTNI